MGPLERPLAFN